ncbi:CLUMA_CG008260, isoform A [Clunio marinus]|uniref:CLUMA_CG008260, isoform A n=1 Tax=Clunio marinus TaxID=568069 RepID=A0A1J1I741_9DIPT|nr:CLUMA_CG008260, isoform A [Clunio marinus]
MYACMNKTEWKVLIMREARQNMHLVFGLVVKTYGKALPALIGKFSLWKVFAKRSAQPNDVTQNKHLKHK